MQGEETSFSAGVQDMIDSYVIQRLLPHGLGNGLHGLGIAIYCYLYHGEVR